MLLKYDVVWVTVFSELEVKYKNIQNKIQYINAIYNIKI